MHTLIYWFRNDIRLSDNAALTYACEHAEQLITVFVHPQQTAPLTRWGIARTGLHRQRFVADSLADLSRQLAARGSLLVELHGRPQDVLPTFAQAIGADTIVCEAIAAPEEETEISALRDAGLSVKTFWQSSLLDPAELTFPVARLPDVFSHFKQAVEREQILPPAPVPRQLIIPPLPTLPAHLTKVENISALPPQVADVRSSFPYQQAAFAGGETAAAAHVEQYFLRKLAHSYKTTRNALMGIDYSTKFSPWLAVGALSARTIYVALQRFENEHGANDGTYWLWFELLWRDYFRFLHLKYGRKLYRVNGLADTAVGKHDSDAFNRWCRGETGEPLVDAGMRELAQTGYLSNRLRQIVASYLIYDLQADWRAGAAWFESQLIDYDVYSNQGNWLYIAGRGTDPRGGRRFNPDKQAQAYDANGRYRALWARP
jgi:deoxyribodipyrimidine photo-lyase